MKNLIANSYLLETLNSHMRFQHHHR